MRIKLIQVCCALGLLGITTGCRGMINGHWRMVEVVPNKDVIKIDNADFNSNGTYTADTTFEGQSAHESGTYDFNGYKLSLMPKDGGRREFTATLKMNRLELVDKKKRLVLQKGG